MYEFPKTILILEPDVKVHNRYNLALDGGGYFVEFATSSEEFFRSIVTYIPSVMIINDTNKKVDGPKIVKKIKKMPVFSTCGLVMLVDKIGHATTAKAKQLKVEIEKFPIENHHLLQMVKKNDHKLVLPEIVMTEESAFQVENHFEFTELNQLELNFHSRMKLKGGETVNISGELLNLIGIHGELFEIPVDGSSSEEGGFDNKVLLSGLSNEALKNMKLYQNGKLK